jgi:hypothetical protein
LTVGVKFELEILRRKDISLFGELHSSEYDPTSIERRMEGNDWHKIHQETLHKLLVVILSYYQKVHSLSDLREIMTDLISMSQLSNLIGPLEKEGGLRQSLLVEGTAGVERNLFVRSPHCCFVTIA